MLFIFNFNEQVKEYQFDAYKIYFTRSINHADHDFDTPFILSSSFNETIFVIRNIWTMM